jgi:hypothetical protein
MNALHSPADSWRIGWDIREFLGVDDPVLG